MWWTNGNMQFNVFKNLCAWSLSLNIEKIWTQKYRIKSSEAMVAQQAREKYIFIRINRLNMRLVYDSIFFRFIFFIGFIIIFFSLQPCFIFSWCISRKLPKENLLGSVCLANVKIQNVQFGLVLILPLGLLHSNFLYQIYFAEKRNCVRFDAFPPKQKILKYCNGEKNSVAWREKKNYDSLWFVYYAKKREKDEPFLW